MVQAELRRIADREQIIELVRMERYLRDHARWDELAECYIPGAPVRTTWFSGSAQDFARASQEMAEQRGRLTRHLITPTYVRINDDRALVDSYGEIHNRSAIDGVELDAVQYCRFFSRVARTTAGWRLGSFDGIYSKDLIWPVDPGEQLPFSYSELAHLRPSYRVWAYTLGLKGYIVGDNELGDDRPDLLAAFYSSADAWLQEVPAAS